jgi:hypothetical protein
MNGDKHPPRQPKWVARLIDLIHRHWQYHAPCNHVGVKAFWDEEYGEWRVNAAPVFQEVLGGEDDGKKVWAGFVFEMGGFSHSPGVWIQEQAVASYCNECTPFPKLMAKGKFEGHPFLLHVYLEPIADSDTVEVIDTITNEIREKASAGRDADQPTPEQEGDHHD